MKKLTQVSLTTILLLSLTGCNPTSLLNNEQLDPNLPKLTNIKAIPSSTSVAFEWQPMAKDGVTGYNVYRTKSNQYINSQTKQLIKVGTIRNRFSSHFIDTGLSQDSAYTYTFTTLRNNFESSYGKVMTVKTLAPFEAVTFFQGFQKSRTNIKLIWRPHSDMRVKMYKIERNINGGEWKWIGSVEQRMMSEYIDTSIVPNNSYSYRVIAVGFDSSYSKTSPAILIQSR